MKGNFLLVFLLILTGCGGGGGSSTTNPPPPPITQDTVVDNFQRADLGGNWTIYNGDAGIISGTDLGMRSQTNTLNGLGVVAWSGTTFRADQFSEGVISTNVDPNGFEQVFVRRRASDGLRYGFHWQPGTSGGEWVLKRDGVTGAQVMISVPAARPSPGDRIRIEVRGSLIQGFLNGVKVIEVSDSVLTDPGQPGVAMNITQVTNFPCSFYASWTGGSLN